MKYAFYFLCLSAFASTQESLLANRWVFEREALEKTEGDKQVEIKLKVNYETHLVFEKDKMKKEVVCFFKEPISKTVIVSAEVPAKISANKIVLLSGSNEKKEYKETLTRKSEAGVKKYRSVYCVADIQPMEYDYKIVNDELILKPVEETLKLKKYIQK